MECLLLGQKTRVQNIYNSSLFIFSKHLTPTLAVRREYSCTGNRALTHSFMPRRDITKPMQTFGQWEEIDEAGEIPQGEHVKHHMH